MTNQAGIAAQPGHVAESPIPMEKQADDLKIEIDRTRSDVGQTLSAIEQKLNPTVLRGKAVEELHFVEGKVREAVKEQFEEAKSTIKAELNEAKETVKREVQQALVQAKHAVRAATIGKVETMARHANQSTIEARDSMLDTLWQNPLPTALAGVGLVWLFMNRRNDGPTGQKGGFYPDSNWRRPHSLSIDDGLRKAGRAASEVVHGVQHKVADLATAAGDAATQTTSAAGELAHGAAEAAGNLAHQVSEGVGHAMHDASAMGGQLAEQARNQAKRVDTSIRSLMRDNPLAIGAGVLTVGALVGLALPRTSREDMLMGESRDQFVDRARGVAHDAVDAARQLAQQGIDEVKAGGSKLASPART